MNGSSLNLMHHDMWIGNQKYEIWISISEGEGTWCCDMGMTWETLMYLTTRYYIRKTPTTETIRMTTDRSGVIILHSRHSNDPVYCGIELMDYSDVSRVVWMDSMEYMKCTLFAQQQTPLKLMENYAFGAFRDARFRLVVKENLNLLGGSSTRKELRQVTRARRKWQKSYSSA